MAGNAAQNDAVVMVNCINIIFNSIFLYLGEKEEEIIKPQVRSQKKNYDVMNTFLHNIRDNDKIAESSPNYCH